jgi:DNA-binding CsgD family transcriptional regulator
VAVSAPAGPALAAPNLSAQEIRAVTLWAHETKHRTARLMGISVHTVDQYIDRVRQKYRAAGRTVGTKSALVARIVEDGLLELGAVR